MPRPAKGARLWLRPAEGKRPATWIIRDGNKSIRTGFGELARDEAERKLARYIGGKYEAPRRKRHLDEIPIADVLRIYAQDKIPEQANQKQAYRRLSRLIAWWGSRTLDDVTGTACRAYAKHRGNDGGARRDLQDLSAAIQHHHKESFHREIIRVWLPPRGESRSRWLTRPEIARLVWAAWTMKEKQRGTETRKRTGRHVARAILFAYYTGSRIGDALRASWFVAAGRSYVDLQHGTFYRLPMGKRATNKRQPPVRINDRLLAFLRLWRSSERAFVVEWNGEPVASIKNGFAQAARLAGLGKGVSPHTLRHSRATHMLQAGIPVRDVAEALGMSEQICRDVYGHHSPEHQRRAVNAR